MGSVVSWRPTGMLLTLAGKTPSRLGSNIKAESPSSAPGIVTPLLAV